VAIDINQQTQAFLGLDAQWGIEQFLFGAQGNDLQHDRKSDKVPADGFGQRVKNSLPGQQEASLKIKGMAVMDKGSLNYWLNQWAGRRSPVNAWFALEGLEALQPVTIQPSSIIDSSVSAKLKDPVDFSLELDARGAYNDGVILLSPHNLLSGSTGTGPQDINTLYGGATNAGAAAQLHVWALDGGTSPSVTVTIQHSVDGVTWTNLEAFQPQTAVGSQRIQLPTTTTVNSYIQAIYTTTGTPTGVQVLLGFARGINLNL
jgi:hypothetical protein